MNNCKRQIPVLYCVIASLLLASCGTEEVSFRAVGELTSDRLELVVESNEPIVEITVAEGSTVTRDQLLMRQDDARAKARVQESQAKLAETQARLAELVRGPRSEQVAAARASASGAEQELEFRRSELQRVEALHARSLSSLDAVDRARSALDTARATQDVRRAQLQEALSGTTLEELTQAEQAVLQAQARATLADIDLRRHTLLAPVDGVIDSRLFEVGERPASGQAAMVLLGGKQVYARVYVPEQIRVQVSTGSDVEIFVDGLEESLPGRVRWISSEAAFTPYFALTEHDRSRLSYLAKIDITVDRPRLPDGVPVEVDFGIR